MDVQSQMAATSIVMLLVAYFVPSIIAMLRRHNNAAAIFALNFLLGWTILFWIIAIVWSVTNDTRRAT